jgi:hypothetical protein
MAKSQAGKEAASEELPGAGEQAPENPVETGGQPEPDNKPDDKPAEPVKRLNLVRFLQEKPQGSGIRVLLNAKYRTDVKTMVEWESALADLLNKKTK